MHEGKRERESACVLFFKIENPWVKNDRSKEPKKNGWAKERTFLHFIPTKQNPLKVNIILFSFFLNGDISTEI